MYTKVVLLALVLTFSSNVFAQQVVFYAINYKPAAYYEGGKKQGYYVEILDLVAKQLGYPDAEIILAPYPRIQAELNNNVDKVVITCLFPSTSFNHKVQQLASVAYFDTGIISMRESPITWNNIFGKKIGSVKGASLAYGKYFNKLVVKDRVKIIPVSGYKQGLMMLKRGRVDAFAGNLPAILLDAEARELDLAESLTISHKASKVTVSVGTNLTNGQEIVERISSAVNQLKQRGEFQSIVERYLPKAIQPR